MVWGLGCEGEYFSCDRKQTARKSFSTKKYSIRVPEKSEINLIEREDYFSKFIKQLIMFNLKSLRLGYPILVATSLFLVTLTGTGQPANANPATSTLKQSRSVTLAPQRFCRQQGRRLNRYFETRNFHVYLCSGRNNRLFYYGIDKRTGSSIALPAYTEEGTGYVAENGQYNYIVTGASLSVYRNGILLREERVIRSL